MSPSTSVPYTALPSFTPTKAEDGNSAVQNDTSDKSADNLGAFKPTTSCSELDTLMPKTDTTKSKKAPIKKEDTEPSKLKSNPKKRGSPVQSNAPSKKTAKETNQLPHKLEQKKVSVPAQAPAQVPAQVPAPAPTCVVAPPPPPPPPLNKSALAHSTTAQTHPPNMRVSPNIVPPVQYVMPQQNQNPHPIHSPPASVSAPPVVHHRVAPVITHLPQLKNPGPHANIIPAGPPKINTSVVPVAPTHNTVNTVTPHPPPHPKNHTTPRNQKQQPEAQFKDVAQAAVSNLILNVASKQQKQNHSAGMNPNQPKKTVNTSSAHIAALTSSNWVAACSAGVDDDAEPGSAEAEQAAALAAANDPAAAKAARARRANLSPDERARQNRDRNREHARNTRLRKKAYVEELKKTLTELVAQRDTSDLEKRHETQRNLEVREVRFRVMEEFLKLRACGGDAGLLARWAAILHDGFTLTLPKTPYRQMAVSNTPCLTKLHRTESSENTNGMTVASLNNPNEQVMKGATESMADAAKVSTFISSLGSRPHSNPVTMSYLCDRKYFMMDGTSACLDWVLTTSGLLNQVCIKE